MIYWQLNLVEYPDPTDPDNKMDGFISLSEYGLLKECQAYEITNIKIINNIIIYQYNLALIWLCRIEI